MPHQIVAIERDVQRAGRHIVAVDLVQRSRRFAAPSGTPRRADADQRDLVEAAVALENFVRDARQRARHPIRVHHQRHGAAPARRHTAVGNGAAAAPQQNPGRKIVTHHLLAASQGRVKEFELMVTQLFAIRLAVPRCALTVAGSWKLEQLICCSWE